MELTEISNKICSLIKRWNLFFSLIYFTQDYTKKKLKKNGGFFFNCSKKKRKVIKSYEYIFNIRFLIIFHARGIIFHTQVVQIEIFLFLNPKLYAFIYALLKSGAF